MNITLHVRLREDSDTFIVGTSGSAEHCVHWLAGFLCEGVIVDSMKVL